MLTLATWFRAMWFVTSQNDRTIPADQRPLVAKASNIVPGQHPQTRTTQEMARVIGTTAPARLVCRPRSWRDRPLRCGPSMRSELSQPYAVSVFSVTASAAFRITSSTKLRLDSIGTWPLSSTSLQALPNWNRNLRMGLCVPFIDPQIRSC